jgi:hypothetical protein
VLGRVLLGAACAELGFGEIMLSQLGEQADGAPLVPPGLSGSIAHSGAIVGAIAAVGSPIGFDVEHEDAGLLDYPIPVHDVRHWVMAEAVAKGSSRPLADILALLTDHDQVPSPWFTQTFRVGKDALACIATTVPSSAPSIVRWTSEQAVLSAQSFARAL